MPKTVTFNHVAGLHRTLRALPKEANVELRDASVRIADEVAQKTATRMRMVGGVLEYVAPTVKAKRDRIPKIVMGSTQLLPDRGGALRDGRAGPRNVKNQTIGNVMWGGEFGSDRHTQFSPWRGNKEGAGYALWPTIRGERDMIMDEYGDAILRAVDKAAR